MKKLIFALFFSSLHTYASTIDDCNDSIPLGSIAACYERNFKLEDTELNKAYAELKSAVSSSGYDNYAKETYWTKVVQSQRYWIKLRDAQCEAKGVFFEDKSLAQIIEMNKCYLSITKERVKWLGDEKKFIAGLP